MLERYLPRIEFDSYEDFKQNYKVNVPENFNFGWDIVDGWAKEKPENRALVWVDDDGEEHTFTFADMKRWSDKTANFLSDQGLGQGDFVMVILRRHYQFWMCALALHKIGALLVPATFMLREHDLEYRLQACSCKAIVCTDAGAIANVVDAVAPNCPDLQKKILVAAGGAGLAIRKRRRDCAGQIRPGLYDQRQRSNDISCQHTAFFAPTE